MRISTFTWLHSCLLSAFCTFGMLSSFGQDTNAVFNRIAKDTATSQLNMDATYNRPFLTMDKFPVAVGGYVEANSRFAGEEGVNEGLSFQIPRLTLFMSSSISRRISFLSELEFEEGGGEIVIEFAAMDIKLHPMLNLRGGVIMNPIGAFNQNHDGPKWEFVQRPDMAVNMLAATWSTPGFGIFGKTRKGKWVLGYEAYLSNGFNDAIIDNEQNKTYLPATKNTAGRFSGSHNGAVLTTEKVSIRHGVIGELGLSHMGGIFNTFEAGGVLLDQKRRVDVFAVDFSTTIKGTHTRIVTEAALIKVDVPVSYTQQYGNQQYGFFTDVVQRIWKGDVLGWDNATLNVACRINRVDWNTEVFRETQTDIGDELWAVTPAISFRPSSQTVLRLNYRRQWQWDILNNPSARAANWMFGFSTYF